MWMNQWDVEDAVSILTSERAGHVPNLVAGAEALERLMQWTNSHSDGWPYWQKPSNAASRLMGVLHAKVNEVRRTDIEDITEAELKRLLVPIKSFLTRRGVDHALVLPQRHIT